MEYEEMGKKWLRGEIEITKIDNVDGDTLHFHSKQTGHLNDKHRFSLAVGGMACVHADTLIDTVKGKVKASEFKGGLVYSKEGIALATASQRFNKTPLFKVMTSIGAFVGTANHRVWTNQGWKKICELGVSDMLPISEPFLQESNLDTCLSVSPVNDHRYFEIIEGSRGDCRLSCRLYGRLPRWVKDNVPASFPLKACVHGHNQLRSDMGDCYISTEYNHLYQWFVRLSRIDSLNRTVRRLLILVNRTAIKASERTLYSSSLPLRFHLKTFRFLRRVLRVLYSLCSYPNPTTKILKIKPVEVDNYYDLHVYGTNNYSAEGVYHHNSGKTVAWQTKLMLFALWFPGTRILVGRKTKMNAWSTFMKDFVDICPPGLYEAKVGDGVLKFSNGTEVVFFGLDALQGGSGDDMKKAVQDLKSHNFGFIFIDQLEEIEMKVFEALNSRMRRRQCKHGQVDQEKFRDKDGHVIFEECNICHKATFNQMNFTMNPANHWAYDYFKANPRPMTWFIETSMLDNKEHLPEAFITSELAKPKRYVQKYVYGEWSPDSLVEGAVFAEDYIKKQAFYVQDPLREFDGISIFEEPTKAEYQIAVDPSEGAVDPCAIQVVNINTGVQVATYSAFVPLNVITDKIMHLTTIYSLGKKPLVIVEAQGGGQAVIEDLKKRYSHIYEREVFNQRQKKHIKKLGWFTNFSTKVQLIEHTGELFQKNFIKLRDRKTLEEMKTFIYSDEAKKKGAGAQTGYHDDRIMALMMAYWNIKAKNVEETSLLSPKHRQNRKRNVKYQYI